MVPGTTNAAKIALFVAHPGHELRAFHWLESAQPRVYVLTDGSGRSGVSRLDYTSEVLRQAGAKPGSVYGHFTDRQVYDLLLGQHRQPLVDAARELADDLVRHEIEWVFGDATEGFNPSHDICRLMIGAAVAAAGRRLGRPIATLAFPLHAPPHIAPPGYTSEPLRLVLSAAALARKLAAARDYRPLAAEVARTLARHSAAVFQTECFWLTDADDGRSGPGTSGLGPRRPWYEEYAAQLVEAGQYRQIIRFHPHIDHLAHALWRELGGEPCGERNSEPAAGRRAA